MLPVSGPYQLETGAVRRGDYLRFAARAFGAREYQASRRYVEWLYDHAPSLAGHRAEMLTAYDAAGAFVGCCHRMPALWRIGDVAAPILALHNAMVAEEHRRGVGALLITEAFRHSEHAFVPGAVDRLAATYQRLGFVLARMQWWGCWLQRGAGSVRALTYRLAPSLLPPVRLDRSRLRRFDGSIERSAPTSLEELRPVVDFSSTAWRELSGVVHTWTEGLFYWRFFHPLGPRHWLLTFREESAIGGYIVVSLGRRKGVTVARVVELRCTSFSAAHALVLAARDDARRLGAHLLLVAAAEPRTVTWLSRMQLKPWPHAPDTLIFHRDRDLRSTPHAFMPSAGDYGFEAILTET